MRVTQTIDPGFEFDTGAVLWAAVTVFLSGLVVNFALGRPGWLIPGALLAGGVAAIRADYYEPSGNSAALGVAIGGLAVAPVLALSRLVLIGVGGEGDVGFLAVALSGAWVAIVAITIVPVGYLGAAVTDYVISRESQTG